MTDAFLVDLFIRLIKLIGLIVAPVVIGVVFMGLVSNVFQTVTQMKDQTLTFVPKMVVALCIIAVAAPWYFRLIKEYFFEIMELVGQGAAL